MGPDMGHRTSVAIDMHSLVEESAWERVSRLALLAAVPLSLLAFFTL